jgi:imidazoleglycerol-phosphate dehydratase
MDSADIVLNDVIQLQKAEGYSDQKMADKIGCSRPLYQRTRTGKIPVGGTFLKGAMQLLASLKAVGRKSTLKRDTSETAIKLELNLDGTGNWNINTGIKMFDHLLSQMAKHGIIDINLSAIGDDIHHVVEDVAISLGRALGEALGEKRGIVRMASVSVPMDDALVNLALDISGRGYAVLNLEFTDKDISGLDADLVRHFLETFAVEARINLHASIVCGNNDHHKAEALFKALGRALDAASRIDERIAGELPTTKGRLER